MSSFRSFDPVFFESRKTENFKSEYIKGQIVLQLILGAGHVGHMSEYDLIFIYSADRNLKVHSSLKFKRLSRRRPFKKAGPGNP